MDALLKDLRYAFRMLVKAPVFTLVAVLSLALGIGANATIFTIINAVFLSALPVDRANELVAVYTADANTAGGFGGLNPISYPNFKDLRTRNDVFVAAAAYSPPFGVSIVVDREPVQAQVEIVTGSYFETLGVQAAKGRALASTDDVTVGGHPVAVISHGFWQRRLGGDAGAVGRDIKVNGTTLTILGVTPEGFKGVNALFSPDLWVPFAMGQQTMPVQFRDWLEERRALLCNVAARLRPGATLAQADAFVKALGNSLAGEYPIPNKGRTFTVRPLTEATIFPAIRGAFVGGSVLLMVVVGLVLLIACSNVANLLMARATSREQEMAVRTALGAGRGRLVRQLLTESAMLAACGGLVGLLLASLARNYLWSLRPPFLDDNFVQLSIDPTVLVFTAGLSLLTAVVFGLLPAMQASRIDVQNALKEESRGSGRSRRKRAIASGLVIAQVSLSVIALVAAGLFLRSLDAGSRIDPGFPTAGLVGVAVSPGQAAYERGRAEDFYRQVRDRVSTLPGIASTAWANASPLTGSLLRTVVPFDREQEDVRTFSAVVQVSPGYFGTLGLRLIEGRDFTTADREGAPKVAVINDTFAARIWPGQSALGKRFRFFEPGSYHEVVGVVSTAKFNFLAEDPQIGAYIPADQNFSDFQILFARTSRDADAALGLLQQTIRSFDAQVPQTNPLTMQGIVAQSLWPARMAAILLGTLGAVALVLASIGLYGLMAYSVTQRQREIGLRIALGADPPTVLRGVLREGGVLVAIGLAIGLTLALATGRAIAGLLYGVSPADPLTLGLVALVLGAVALVASLVPALRASRVDPVVALR